MGALTLSDLTPMAGEPCVQDLRVAEALGYDRTRKVRDLIERNRPELESYGPLAVRYGKSRGQSFSEFFLSEGQALVICALARTDKAAAVRRQLIEVFLAWRHGELTAEAAGPDHTLRVLQRLEARLAALEATGGRMVRIQSAPAEAATALTHAVEVWSSQTRQTRPAFWSDVEVRGLVLATHRQMTLDEAHSLIVARCGAERAPSRSAVHRFWKRLDRLRGAYPSVRSH